MTTPISSVGLGAAAGRRRAQLGLAAAALAVLVAAALLMMVLGPLSVRRPVPPTAPTPVPPGAVGPLSPEAPRADGWDWAGEAALATHPMPVLPVAAAQPQTLATAAPTSAPLRLPAPTDARGRLAGGFPDTPAGAVAALAAWDTAGLAGADPQVYARVYQAVAAAGAPPAAASRLGGLLRDIRATAQLPPTGPIAGLTVTYQVSEAQIKGLRDGGRYAVVCVLGQLSADYQGQLLTDGVADCQALRYVPATGAGGPPAGADGPRPTIGPGQWRISPGPAATAGPDAWPGSQDAVNTGYQEVAQ